MDVSALYLLLPVVLVLVASQVCPKLMRFLMSNPYANQISWNLGPQGLEYQVVCFVAYHLGPAAIWSHCSTLLVDMLAWLVVIGNCLNWETVLLMDVLLFAQAVTFRDRKLSCALISAYCLYTVTAFSFLTLYSSTAIWWAELAIVASAFVRFLGHLSEHLPPYILGNPIGWRVITPAQLLKRKNLQVVPIAIAGVLSELTAGIPGRLFPSLVHYLMLSWGIERELMEEMTTSLKKNYNLHDVQQVVKSLVYSGTWEPYQPAAKLFIHN